jgi:uridine kinase
MTAEIELLNKSLVELSGEEMADLVNLCTEDGISVQAIISNVFGEGYDPSSRYVICVQGPSCSGKSTLAHNIFDILSLNGIECFLLEVDNFYKSFSGAEEDISKYDFDNPGAIAWDRVSSVLRAIRDREEKLPFYEHSFLTHQSSGPFYVENTHPTVIIIEGIYAFNVISEEVFNADGFDPLDSNKKVVPLSVPSVENFKDFKVLKLRLAICHEKSLKVRVARDVIQRGRTREMATSQFKNQVWPATLKWVNSPIFEENIKIIHGSFNVKKVQLLLGAVSQFFVGRPFCFKGIHYDGGVPLDVSSIECSRQCQFQSKCDVILTD